MSEIRERFIEILLDLGHENPDYRSEKLKKRICKAFGENISFWHPCHRIEPEMVFSNITPKGMYVEKSAKLAQNLSEQQTQRKFARCV